MPTFVHGKNSKFYISAAGTQTSVNDISSSLKEIGFPRNIDMAETSAFGNTNKTYIQGLADASFSASGQWAAGSATDIDQLMSDLIGAAAATNFAYAPAGVVSTTGSPITTVTGSAAKPVFYGTLWLASYEITGSIGDVVAVSMQFQPAGDIERATAAIVVSTGAWV